MKFQEIHIKSLIQSPTNPRKTFDKDRIEEMAESIRAVGILEPLLVVPRGGDFEIVSGESRFRGAQLAGSKLIPCMVREMTDAEILRCQMAENISRSSLNPMEEAEGIDRMREAGDTEEQIAKVLGTSEKWVQGRLSLTFLPDKTKDAVRVSALSVGVARELLTLEREEIVSATEMLLEFEEEITVEQARLAVHERYRAPRQRREDWRKAWEDKYREQFPDADPVEDSETWAEYLTSYGAPVGPWASAGDPLGGAAARHEDREITWGELAKAIGVRGVVVPLVGTMAPVHLVNRELIQSAESSARERGEKTTLGPRKHSATAADDDGDDVVYESGADDDGGIPPALDREAVEGMIASLVEQLEDDGLDIILQEMAQGLRERPDLMAYICERLGYHDEVCGIIDAKEGQST